MNNSTKINEIFSSIQGEGRYIGYKQLFVRFCKCNLNCKYCDTDFQADANTIAFTSQKLQNEINNYDLTNIHSISLTGGEPLVDIEFLEEFLPLINNYKIYLETNATLIENLSRIIDYIDIVACDIKLESASGKDNFKLHDEFIKIACQKECFAKIVFDKNITDDEIIKCCDIAKKYNIELILQPMMQNDKLSVNSEFIENILNNFLSYYKNVRVIPQMHKFINVK